MQQEPVSTLDVFAAAPCARVTRRFPNLTPMGLIPSPRTIEEGFGSKKFCLAVLGDAHKGPL